MIGRPDLHPHSSHNGVPLWRVVYARNITTGTVSAIHLGLFFLDSGRRLRKDHPNPEEYPAEPLDIGVESFRPGTSHRFDAIQAQPIGIPTWIGLRLCFEGFEAL